MKKSRELYKKCEKCLGHSFLTMGNFYLCTMCGHREYTDVGKDKCFQKKL